MIPDAYLSHQTSERLRVKIPSKKGDSAYFLSLKQQASKYNAIEAIEVNPLTASVLFIHNLNKEAIAGFAEENKLFRLVEKPKESSGDSTSLSKQISEVFKNLNKEVSGFTGRELDIPTLAFLGLLALGIFQISRGNFTAPAWYTAFWYALNIFLKAQPDKGNMGE